MKKSNTTTASGMEILGFLLHSSGGGEQIKSLTVNQARELHFNKLKFSTRKNSGLF